MNDPYGIDAITKDASKNLVGQTSAQALPSLGLPLGVDLGTKGLQGLVGIASLLMERSDEAKRRKLAREQFDRQMALQERGQDFRESNYREESPFRTAQAAASLNNVAGQNLKYLDLLRGIRGVGV